MAKPKRKRSPPKHVQPIRPDGFRPASAWDVSDENPRFLARRLDGIVVELRTTLDQFGGRIEASNANVMATLSDLDHRVNLLERRVGAIESWLPKPRRRRRTKAGRK